MVIPLSIRPPSRSRQYASSLGQWLTASRKSGKSGQNGGRFFFEWGGEDGDAPSVRSHWGQVMAATFTKANSPEEQSTSPVAADYSIITSIGLTASISSTHYSKFMQTFNVQNDGGGGCGGGDGGGEVGPGGWVWNVKVQQSPWSGWC